MTAEVVVMNMQAIAMAADSAVTIGDKQKIFNSANKLFMLSKYHPIGIMLYNDATLMTLPWETIIGVYRKQLGTRSFGTVQEYVDNFVQFLETKSEEMFSVGGQEFTIIEIVRDYYVNAIKAEVEKRAQPPTGNPELDKSHRDAAIAEVIHEYFEVWKDTPLCVGLTQEFLQTLQTRFDDVLNFLRELVFAEYTVTPESIDELKTIGVSIICSSNYDPPTYTGLVFAGFGENEMIPQCLAFEVKALLASKLIYQPNKQGTAKLDWQQRGLVLAYAQHDVVATFVEGINPAFNSVIRSSLRELLTTQLAPIIIEQMALGPDADVDGIQNELTQRFTGLADGFLQSIDQYLHSNYVSPILRAVSILPKDELAALAQALVNITSVKRKISMEAETVGGPVDVAVISKKDGFIWITRKHYFEPTYNPQFFHNYFTEVHEQQGGQDG